MTKFSSTLPKGEANGLTSLHNQLLANPKGTHLVVGVIDVKTITTDVDTGDQVATVRFRRVEPIAAQDADEAVRLMQRGTERRTGATMLPIEIEDELRELMANLDFATGELPDDPQPGDRNFLQDGHGYHPGPEDGIADPAEPGPGDPDRPGRAEPAKGPDEAPPGIDDEPNPPTPGPDTEPPTIDDDPEPTQPQEPVEDPAPPAEAPAEPPKKKRGRPRKVKEDPPAPAAPEDLAAATVPAAPWDDYTETTEPETKED